MLFVDKKCYSILKDHIDHEIVITEYEANEEIAIECEDCYTVLISYMLEED